MTTPMQMKSVATSDWVDSMLNQVELDAIVEGLFGPKKVYVELLLKEGEEAEGLLKAIGRHGAKSMMETILLGSNLTQGAISDSSPWSMFDHVYQMGDYFLVWSFAKKLVGLYEVNIPSDPYSNV